MKQVEVRIMGQNYLLGCAEGAENDLMQAVKIVDQEMCAIRDGGKVKARERIAVLAALNIALTSENKTPETTQNTATQQDELPEDSQTQYEDLVYRIDRVLGQDGLLL